MKVFRIVFLMFAMAVSSFATYMDYFFHLDEDSDNGLCLSASAVGGKSYDMNGALCSSNNASDIRVRIVNAPKNSSQRLGFDVERPFLIIDGIYLGTDGERTIDDLYDETNQVGLAGMLTNLGYTPIYVQFSETVRRSLYTNAQLFTHLLRYINNNKMFGFANRTNDGFVIMGISQGGVISRYGAYLYDRERTSNDAPIRLYSSLDSPHQGAVIPKSILYTINFWDFFGGSPAAEQFSDLLESPGVSELLINKTKLLLRYRENFSTGRFLFGEYRNACEYKGFPSVLISEGQLKGTSIPHSDTFFLLNRRVKKLGQVMGRVESYLYSTGTASNKQLVYNRIYRKTQTPTTENIENSSMYDFVQGSTHTFPELLYSKLRDGFIEKIPESATYHIKTLGISYPIKMSAAWDNDTLYQAKATFIPTASAMDLKCNGNIAMNQDCAFNQASSGIAFENPRDRSSANAAYAVDPTHPRYGESISGKHIELPWSNNKLDTTVLRGMQTDIWRILCELSKVDYDSTQGDFRNPNLAEHFIPGESCLDRANIPAIISNAGLHQQKAFSYARYDYDSSATEKKKSVSFDLAAGWHRVAWFDNGEIIPEGSAFEVDIKVDNAKNDWMKAELLLHLHKNNNNQLQLTEVSVPTDGKKHTLHWDMPFSQAAMSQYRWFRLILNSDGAHVTLTNPRLVKSGIEAAEPESITSSNIFPNGYYTITPWNSNTTASSNGNKLRIHFNKVGAGLHIKFGTMQNLKKYSSLVLNYIPGTCQETSVYFDSYRAAAQNLSSSKLVHNDDILSMDGYFSQKIIPLSEIIDTRTTPNFSLSASFLSMISTQNNEVCDIRKIYLK